MSIARPILPPIGAVIFEYVMLELAAFDFLLARSDLRVPGLADRLGLIDFALHDDLLLQQLAQADLVPLGRILLGLGDLDLLLSPDRSPTETAAGRARTADRPA